MLQKVGKYNDIPADLLPDIPAASDTPEVFRCLITHFDPIANKGKPETLFPEDLPIPMTSKFRNPKTGEWIHIGLVYGIDKDGNPLVSQEMRQAMHWAAQKNAGYFRIHTGQTALQDTIYQYLRLASFVQNNPNRDQSEVPIMEYVDVKAEARKATDKQQRIYEAQKAAFGLSDDQVKDIAIRLQLDRHADVAILRPQIVTEAAASPDLFMDMLGDADAILKTRINEAIQAEIVLVDLGTQHLKWNDERKKIILKLVDTSNEGIQHEYALWAKTPEGKKIDEMIALKLKKEAVTV